MLLSNTTTDAGGAERKWWLFQLLCLVMVHFFLSQLEITWAYSTEGPLHHCSSVLIKTILLKILQNLKIQHHALKPIQLFTKASSILIDRYKLNYLPIIKLFYMSLDLMLALLVPSTEHS